MLYAVTHTGGAHRQCPSSCSQTPELHCQLTKHATSPSRRSRSCQVSSPAAVGCADAAPSWHTNAQEMARTDAWSVCLRIRRNPLPTDILHGGDCSYSLTRRVHPQCFGPASWMACKLATYSSSWAQKTLTDDAIACLQVMQPLGARHGVRASRAMHGQARCIAMARVTAAGQQSRLQSTVAGKDPALIRHRTCTRRPIPCFTPSLSSRSCSTHNSRSNLALWQGYHKAIFVK